MSDRISPWLRRHQLGASIFALGLTLAALPVAAQAPGPGPGKSYALLIGVGAYQHWSRLVNPLPDVKAVQGELQRRYGFLAEVLPDPDRKQILRTLRSYADRTYGPGDRLLILFAGHGTYDEVTDTGYLVASDSASRQRDPNFETFLSYPFLTALIDHIPCRHILLVVDACYSGTLGASGDARPAGASASSAGARPGASSRRFITSGGKQYVPDGDPDRHTPFIRQFLAGLGSPGSDGVLTLEELESRFMARVEPQPRWGRFGGDAGAAGFAFISRPRGEPAPIASAAAPAGEEEPPAPAATRLRATPDSLVESVERQIFRQLGLYDVTWSPEGDFPNQFRTQRRDLWDVVLDLESGLTWQQAGSSDRRSRAAAESYVQQLNRERHAGHADWRLPTLEELASLLEPNEMSSSLHIDPKFDPEQEDCWSADRDRASGQPYFVSFSTGSTVLAYGKNRSAFVRAVRTN